MAKSAVVDYQGPEHNFAFPAVDPGVEPFGSRVLVQIRRSKERTASGLFLVSETKDTEKWNTQIAKVVSMGPLAFKNREKGEAWVEGDWCKKGDFIRCPKYGGDRWEVPIADEEPALFVIYNDLDLIGRVTVDPLSVKAFI